ncbi:hypothetical protein NCCP133_33150 [Cytobacillus sp. NCCP-133]|nr:hypothetical protein NCCP133_33150 [Cytobacillus sp. NCCP-133]
MTIVKYGFDDFFKEAFSAYEENEYQIGRVALEHKRVPCVDR